MYLWKGKKQKLVAKTHNFGEFFKNMYVLIYVFRLLKKWVKNTKMNSFLLKILLT